MSLDVVIGVVGVLVTILVVAGMILITPRGVQSSSPAAEPPGVEERERGALGVAEVGASRTEGLGLRDA